MHSVFLHCLMHSVLYSLLDAFCAFCFSLIDSFCAFSLLDAFFAFFIAAFCAFCFSLLDALCAFFIV